MPDELTPVKTLDLRKTKCPLNFVKTKLALEKLEAGQILEVWIEAEGESALNIPNSLEQEGHIVLSSQTDGQEKQTLLIQKC